MNLLGSHTHLHGRGHPTAILLPCLQERDGEQWLRISLLVAAPWCICPWAMGQKRWHRRSYWPKKGFPLPETGRSIHGGTNPVLHFISCFLFSQVDSCSKCSKVIGIIGAVERVMSKSYDKIIAMWRVVFASHGQCLAFCPCLVWRSFHGEEKGEDVY